MMSQERMEILRMVEAGQIDAEEAAMLLESLEPSRSEPAPESAPLERQEQRWTSFWIYPMMAGGGLLILGTMVMGLVQATDAARGWALCGWLPMILGLTVILLALWTRKARWLHLRITEEGRRKLALSFPLPLGLAAWVFRVSQPFVPQLSETGVDDLIIALRDGTTGDEPIFIDIVDEDDGERVQLYLG